MSYLCIFRLEFEKTIVIFEVRDLEFFNKFFNFPNKAPTKISKDNKRGKTWIRRVLGFFGLEF